MVARPGEEHERTPLLRDDTTKPLTQVTSTQSITKKWPKSTLLLGLLAGFLVSMSFGVTQVPLIYVFRVMTCEAYYTHHPPPPPGFTGDRCSVRQIESDTAKQVAILSGLTTALGLINLFGTGWSIRRFGIKLSLVIQVFWPAMRLLVQNIGVTVGGARGIIITQASQLITVVGGPVGYLLALNSFITEVVDNEERTGALGRLQGSAMLGTSIGYLAGGLIGEKFGIIWPFRVTFLMFLMSTIYVAVVLPSVPLPVKKEIEGEDRTARDRKSGSAIVMQKVFGPMAVFKPTRWVTSGGTVRTEYGAILLAMGCFFGVLATGVIPVLLQMYSTDVLGFGTALNSELVSLNALLRGLFLTLLFPRIIKGGRAWLVRKNARQQQTSNTDAATTPTEANIGEAITRTTTNRSVSSISSLPSATIPLPKDLNEADEPTLPPTPPSPSDTNGPPTINPFAFDLLFTRYSLLADGLLTGLAVFVTQGWQIFAVAIVLPFASGTGSAAKGTILQMCPPEMRTEALQAMTLVDMIARLSTITLFGLVFAAFAEIGRTNLVFGVNAAIAVLGFIVMLPCRFPAADSQRWVPGDEAQDGRPAGEPRTNGQTTP